jgi:hypothetical protein
MDQVTLSNPHWETLTPGTRQAFDRAVGLKFIQRYYLADRSPMIAMPLLW